MLHVITFNLILTIIYIWQSALHAGNFCAYNLLFHQFLSPKWTKNSAIVKKNAGATFADFLPLKLYACVCLPVAKRCSFLYIAKTYIRR